MINRLKNFNSILLFFVTINAVYSLSIKSFDPILWSTHNKMFESSSLSDKSTTTTTHKEHIIDVRIGDFLNIVCPKFAFVNSQYEAEYHALYKVSKEEYFECKIKNIDIKHPILKCDRPSESVKYTLYISSFSPVPDAIEFTPGNNYYFISASNGSINGLANSEGGTCKSNNMKIIVKVLDSRSHDATSKKPKLNPNNNNNKKVSPSPPKLYNIYPSVDLQTRNIDSIGMTIFSKFKMTSGPPRTSTTTTISTTTKSPNSNLNSKTVNDNIFILEPDSIDYNDILSQLISSSSSYSSYLNNSENLNDKLSLETDDIERVVNNCSYLKTNFFHFLIINLIFLKIF